MPRRAQSAQLPELPNLDCACASVRRASRLLTQLYAREMGSQVEPSQFMLLSALQHLPGRSQKMIGGALGFDKTTLSRNLRLMRRNGWIEPSDEGHRLTATGANLLAATTPGWQRAQQKLRSVMTGEEWENMFKVFGHAAKAAIKAKNQETDH